MMSSRRFRFALLIGLVVGLIGASIAVAATRHHGKGDHGDRFFAHLTGLGENPSINSGGSADLSLQIRDNPAQLTFTLTYSGLSGNPSAAHVHISQPGVNGGVSFFFCGGGGKPACPASTSGTITGVVNPADVQAISGQGFAAGDLNAVITAIRAGATYANMHTALWPNGEIRGQLGHGHGPGKDG
jgi:hypothetical protein